MEDIREIVKTASALGATETMRALGVTAGELSERQAIRVYGGWFKEAVERKEILPCRRGSGKTGTKRYDVRDILQYKLARQIRRVTLILK